MIGLIYPGERLPFFNNSPTLEYDRFLVFSSVRCLFCSNQLVDYVDCRCVQGLCCFPFDRMPLTEAAHELFGAFLQPCRVAEKAL
jgi:hypothetical protein